MAQKDPVARREYDRQRYPEERARRLEYGRRYYAENRAGILAKQRERNGSERDAKREYNARYHAEHREAQLAYKRAHYALHRRDALARQNEYDKLHRADNAERARRWRAEHPERVRERDADRMRRWRAEHPEAKRAAYAASNCRRKARLAESQGQFKAKDVAAQFERQRGRCFWDNHHALGDSYHVDHVVPLALGGSNGPENIVLACPECNLHKAAKHPMDFAGVMF